MIPVEFYGIPRQRAGTARAVTAGATLGAVLADLAERFPDFADECLTSDGGLRAAYIVNIGGDRFVHDPSTPLVEGDTVLILSADAGG